MTALIWTQVFDAVASLRTSCSIGYPSKNLKNVQLFLRAFSQTLMLVTFLLLQVCLVAGEDTVLICQSNRTEQGDTKVYFATWAERTWSWNIWNIWIQVALTIVQLQLTSASRSAGWNALRPQKRFASVFLPFKRNRSIDNKCENVPDPQKKTVQIFIFRWHLN